jgi:predicted lipoprotein with Yx(FWY)xxD motif
MSRDRSLIGLATLLGLIATQACSSSSGSGSGSDTSAAGQSSSAAGAFSSNAGASSSQAGGAGAGTSGGATGSAGASGSSSAAGSGGSSAGSGGAASGGTANGGASGGGGAGGAETDTFTTHTTTNAGTVLATKAGLTLYFYQPDTPAAGATAATSTCTGTCLTHWPLYYGNPVTVPAGLDASDFGSFDRGGGVMQSTYHGWPVYTYDDDSMPGQAKGDMEKNTMGKVIWYAVRIPFSAPPKP